MDSSNWSSRLREHRGTLATVALGIVAFGSLAHEDRTARHAAGIDDTCAWFQMVNQQFPMNRCFSLGEFISMMDRRQGTRDEAPEPDNTRHARSEQDAASNSSACIRPAESTTPPPNPARPPMPDYIAALLQGFECEPEH
jgi:hypothetical protein